MCIRSWVDNFLDRLADLYNKFFIAYSVIGLCVLATLVVRCAPIWPFGYYTAVWILAFFFPASAVIYCLFNLRVRFNEIALVSQESCYHLVYFPSENEQQCTRKFTRYLRRRFAEYYNLYELAVFSLMAGVLALGGGILLSVQFSPPPEMKPLFIPAIGTWVITFGSGFLGALAGADVLIYKKYRTFDIYPSTYLQVTVGLIVGTLAGGLLATVWQVDKVSYLSFAVGFLTTININFLPRLLRDTFAKFTGVQLPNDIPTDLDRVLRNSEAIESLMNISLFSVAELVKAEPIRLYLNMPQPIGVINGWIDEALLHYYFPTLVDKLRDLHIHRFTQLMETLVAKFTSDVEAIGWRGMPITGDATNDRALLTTMQTLVESKVHDRQLGVLSENYRNAVFLGKVEKLQLAA